MVQQIVTLLDEQPGFFLQLVLEHMQISLLSIIAAAILGLLLGICISEFKKTSGAVLAAVNIIYTIPSIALLGFLIPLSGVGDKTAVIALTIYALLPMVRNVHTGLTGINPLIIEAARGMGSTRFQILYKIQLPLALPVILSGLRSMVTMTIALSGIASFIGAGGLGVAIYRGITTNNMSMTLAGSLLIALLAIAFDLLLGLLEYGMKNRHGRRSLQVMPAILIACSVVIVLLLSLPGGKRSIHIATKPMSEQYILGAMLKTMIEQDTGLTVSITEGVGGGTSNIQPAMEHGDFDLYPEYTGTGWNEVLKQDGLYQEKMFDQLQEGYQERYQMKWLGMYGFNNTYGLAVRTDIARKYGLKTYSDLAGVAGSLTLGAEYDFFGREDGYAMLKETYGLAFGDTRDMDISLKYQAINKGQVDVIVIATTDGQLGVSDVVVLEDDRHMYPSYMCGNVIRSEVLDEFPELRATLEEFNGLISDAEMAKMNYRVESEGVEPRQVAEDFLKDKGLLKK